MFRLDDLRGNLWLAATYLAFLEVISFIPAPPFAACIVHASSNGPEQGGGHECPVLHEFLAELFATILEKLSEPDWVIALFTIVLAASTIGLWLATNRLWEAGERQIKAITLTAERQLRAYVGTVSIYFAPNNLANDVIHVVVECENFGQSPAHRCQTNLSLFVDDIGTFGMAPSSLKVENFASSHGKTLMPREKSFTICELNVSGIGGQVFMDSLRQSKRSLYVQGAVFYQDVFGINHLTHVRLRARGPRIDTVSPFVIAEAGNDSD